MANDSKVGPKTNHYEESAIIALVLDFPDFYASIQHLIDRSLFEKIEVQYVMEHINQAFTKHGYVPTRELLYDRLAKDLTVEHPYEEILGLVTRKSDPRDVPYLKDKLKSWAERKAYGLLYAPEAIKKYEAGDYSGLREIFEQANRISDTSAKGFWFFKQLEELFVKQKIKHYKTGFNRLDEKLNDGGPSPGDVLIWMAATNVGKSIMLANNAVASIKSGLRTLFITFELSRERTAIRCLGSLTEMKLVERFEKKDLMVSRAQRVYGTHNADLVLYDLPPIECSVNNVYGICESLRRGHGWKPDVIVLDYLDLMVSRNRDNNKDDYARQKATATELLGLAKREDVLVYTATQTNRSGARAEEGETIQLDQAAESYGKLMPVPYVVTLNQTDLERNESPAQLRLYIAKNTNGPKNELITCTLNYDTMALRQAENGGYGL